MPRSLTEKVPVILATEEFGMRQWSTHTVYIGELVKIPERSIVTAVVNLGFLLPVG